MRASTSPRCTAAPSWATTQVTTPAASARAVASSSWRRASAASLARVVTSSSVPRRRASVCRRAAAMVAWSCARSMSALRAPTSVSARSSAETRPSAGQLALAGHASLQHLAIQASGLQLALELQQLALQGQALLLGLVALAGQPVFQTRHVQTRRRGVEVEDGVPRGHGVAGVLHDAQHARVQGTGKGSFGGRHDDARGLHHRLQPPQRDRGRAHPRAAQGGGEQGREPQQQRHPAQEQRGGHRQPAEGAPAPLVPWDLPVHGRRLGQGRCQVKTPERPRSGTRDRAEQDAHRPDPDVSRGPALE